MIIPTATRLNSVQEYYFSRKLKEIAQMRAAGAKIINLGIGSPDLPPPTAVIERLAKECQQISNHQYQSYRGIEELRQAFADFYKKWYKVSLNATDEILPLMGSKEGIMHLAMTFLEAGDSVLIPNPTYPTYQAACSLAGATCIPYALSADKNWLPDLAALAQQDLTKVKIMWVNYPNMPTGAKATRSFFERLIAFATKHQILICNDNPYSFVLNDDYLSILSIKGAKSVAVELNSLSKSHNMAGWRIGMIAGRSDYIQAVLRFKSNMDSGMFRPMQLAAVSALQQNTDWYQQLNAIYRKRQQKAFKLLDVLACKYDRKVGGMFVWAKVPATYEHGRQLADELLEKTHVFITPGEIFGTNGSAYIRVSLCNPVAVFDEVIQRILVKMKKNA